MAKDGILSKVFGRKKSPREQMAEYREKHSYKHTGKKTIQVIRQEIISHKQNFRENDTPEEREEWGGRLSDLQSEYAEILERTHKEAKKKALG